MAKNSRGGMLIKINPRDRFDLSHLSSEEGTQTLDRFLKDLCFWGSLPAPQCDYHHDSQRGSSSINDGSNDNLRGELIRQKSSGSDRSRGSRKSNNNNNSESSSRRLPKNNNAASTNRPPRTQPTSGRVWKTAVDPATGQTYYYDPVSRQTQWEKPDEIRALEKQQKKEKRQQAKAFFAEMEKSMRSHLKAGRLTKEHTSAELAQLVGGPPKEPMALQVLSKQQRIRTISAMDERMLANVDVDAHAPSSHNGHDNAFHHNNNSALPGPPMDPPHPMMTGAPGRPPLPSRMPSSAAAQMMMMTTLENSPDESANSRNNIDKWDSLELSPDNTYNHLSSPELEGMHLLDENPSNNNNNNTSMASLAEDDKQQQPQQGFHVRRNTGNTMFVSSTMMSPDVEGTIRCVSGVYRAHIQQSVDSPNSPGSVVPVGSTVINPEVFRDVMTNTNNSSTSNIILPTRGIPTLEEIESFYKEFFRRSQMEHDTIIMSLIYIERLIKRTEGTLSPTPDNWRSMLFSSMILASKVWDDLSMWNIDFSNVSVASGLSSFTIQRINQLEIALLSSLRFDVRVSASEYAKYYFIIRKMLFRSGKLSAAEAAQSKPPPVMPPDQNNNRRTKSVDWAAPGVDFGEPLLKNVRIDQNGVPSRIMNKVK